MQQENLVQQWIDSDRRLRKILTKIQNSKLNEEQQAQLAFHKITEKYKLPKFPGENAEYTFSVYEQLALLKFLEPEGDIRGHVLSALCFVKNGYMVDMESVFEMKFGMRNPPPDFSGLGYTGKDIDVEVVFVMKGQGWLDLGCKYFTKQVQKPI